MSDNLNQARAILSRQQRVRNAYDNVVVSDLISKSESQSKERQQIENVTTASQNFVLKNDNVKNTVAVQSGQQKVYDAIRDVSSQYPTYHDALSDVRRRNSTKMISDNMEAYSYIDTDTKEEAPVSAVLSDPDKPSYLERQVQPVETSGDIFKIKNLYSRNEDINPYEYNYNNNVNNAPINTGDIVSFSDQGIITSTVSNYTMPRYYLVPSEQLVQKDPKTVTATPYKFGTTQETHSIVLNERSDLDNVATYRNYRYRYLYCFDNPVAQQRQIKTAAGFVSAPVNVNNCSYVELDADYAAGIEYYVIDDNDEIPILPHTVTYVEDEKLFFGLMPRFGIADPSNIVVKKNGILTNITTLQELEDFLIVSYDQAGSLDFENDNLYTISYTPNESAKRYFVKNDIIQIKGIQRVINNSVPQGIKNIKLLKYGNKNPWHLASFNSDTDYNPTNPLYRRG